MARARAVASSLVATLSLASAASAETGLGLVVAPERRCAPYDRKRNYPYLRRRSRGASRPAGFPPIWACNGAGKTAADSPRTFGAGLGLNQAVDSDCRVGIVPRRWVTRHADQPSEDSTGWSLALCISRRAGRAG